MIAFNKGRLRNSCLWGLAWFAVAFLADQATDQQMSSVWGSLAIAATMLSTFPAIRLAVRDLGVYGLIWAIFALVRAVADTAGTAVTSRMTMSDTESALFGGSLPSMRLQDWLYGRSGHRFYDSFLILVYASFFLTPFLVAILLWWKQRSWFPTYVFATLLMLGLGLVGFLLMPTAPPWMSHAGQVTRITRTITAHPPPLASGESASGPASGDALWFEPNKVAAFPSVHVSAIVLAVLVWNAIRPSRASRWGGALYACLMSFAVVYLGEHFVLDAIAGWIIAWISWQFAQQWLGIPGQNVLRATDPVKSSQARRKDATISDAGTT